MANMLIEKPKIAYVMTPITFGGAEKVNLNFLKNVEKTKFTIEPILFLRPWEPENHFESELRQLGLKYDSIPVAKLPNNNELFRIARCFLNLMKLIHGKSYNLIHTHGYLADLLAILVAKFCNIPIMSTCHGFIYEDRKLSIYNNLDCFVLRYFDRIISVSDSLKSDLINKKICKDKITVIENTPDSCCHLDGISETRKQLRNNLNVVSNMILIGYIGRLSIEKGLIYLLESIKLLCCSSLSFKLVVIGEGPQLEGLKEMVNCNGLTSIVIFAGFQKNIDEWLAAIDLLVLPSLTEGTPMVLLEAMAHGVPCIASAVGGIPKIIESGVEGILITPGKPEEITNAIHCLISDPTKRHILSKNAKCKIRDKYNIKEWTRKIENEYINILNAKSN